jgi:putative endonuclease
MLFLNMRKVMYLYIVRCSDDTLYVGVTNNLERRLTEHNTGVNPKAYTFSRRPVVLVYNKSFTNFQQAFDWETKIKKWSRSKKQALIDGDFDLLKTLSKKDFSGKKL